MLASDQYDSMWEKARVIQNEYLSDSILVTGLPLQEDPADLLKEDESDVVWHPLDEESLGNPLVDSFIRFSKSDPSVSSGYTTSTSVSFTSMSEMMLAFVMKEKYFKTWNGENWV